ncbi:crooked neck-like protein 1 [Tanacetum coccineum]
MKEKDVDDVVEEQILTIKLRAEDSSKKLMKYKLKITNSDDIIVIKQKSRPTDIVNCLQIRSMFWENNYEVSKYYYYVYSECLKLIPHKKFSFCKYQQLNLSGARAVLGNAIGIAPKDKLGNMDHCRKLYEEYLEWSPENFYAWSKYAELERSLMETERARPIFELAIAQPALDMP